MNDPQLEIKPNPAVEGQSVQVTYRGEGTLRYSVDGGSWQELTVDKNGEATFTAPLGARGVVFSDRRGPEGVGGFLDVLSLNK